MASLIFDSLEYSHELEASGVPREQAEGHAKAMAAIFHQNYDALATEDAQYAHFAEFETRALTLLDMRLFKVDTRLDSMEARLSSKIDSLSGYTKERSEHYVGNLSRIYLLFGLTMAALTIQILQNFLGG